MIIQERVPKIVHQLQIRSSNEQAFRLAQAVLINLGYAQTDLISSHLNGQSSIELFDEDPQKLQKIQRLFGRLQLSGLKISRRKLAPRDWLTRWKTQWKPAALTKKLDVVPLWHKAQYKQAHGRDYILIDTLLSFGTGLHETTRFISQFIEDNKGSFTSFLDIGTGTGILALVAIKYGATDVLGIDIGELSVEASRDNMKANKMYFKVIKADIKKYRLSKKFDFVAANLITEDLIANAKKILSFVKDDGLVAVSGISLENLSRCVKAFASLPLRCLKVSKGQQWSGLLYQKKKS